MFQSKPKGARTILPYKNVIRRLIFVNESRPAIYETSRWDIMRKLCSDILRRANFITVYPLYRNDRFTARDECIRKHTCPTTFTKFNYWFFMTPVAMRMKAQNFPARCLNHIQRNTLLITRLCKYKLWIKIIFYSWSYYFIIINLFFSNLGELFQIF